MSALVITLFQLRSFWKVGFLPAVYNQGLFALCINVFSCRVSTVWFSGMTCARGLVSRPATCVGSPPASPSFFGSNHKTRKMGGGKGQRGGVLGSPFLGFRAFTKQGLLKFSLIFVRLLPTCRGLLCVCFSNIG